MVCVIVDFVQDKRALREHDRHVSGEALSVENIFSHAKESTRSKHGPHFACAEEIHPLDGQVCVCA